MKKSRVPNPPSEIIKLCHHCGNTTKQFIILQQLGHKLFEQIFKEKLFTPYHFLVYKCSTCECLNIYGQYEPYLKYTKREIDKYEYVYPEGPIADESIPRKILEVYQEVYHLKHKAPNAFANQIRRILEFICQQQKAQGETLYKQLADLSTKGKFPGNFKEFSDIIRIVGNIGSHAHKRELDIWDVDLLNDFFLIIVEYLYVAPKKIKDLKKRLKIKAKKG
jgi:hypothetical protein